MPKSAVEWCDTYLVGIDDLDADHRELIGLLAEIMAGAQRGTPMSQLAHALTGFIDRFSAHAAKEAEILARLREPASLTHCKLHLAAHGRFVDTATALRDQFAAGNGTPAEIDRLGVLLTLFELIQADYDMVGCLKREGLLTADGPVLPGV